MTWLSAHTQTLYTHLSTMLPLMHDLKFWSNFLKFSLNDYCSTYVKDMFKKTLQTGLVCSHPAPLFANWSNPEQAGIPNSANSHRSQPLMCRERPKQSETKPTASFPTWPEAARKARRQKTCHLCYSNSTLVCPLLFTAFLLSAYLQHDNHNLFVSFAFQRC